MTDDDAGPHDQGSTDPRVAASVRIPFLSAVPMGIGEGVD